mgnify:FL=1
MKIQPLWTVCLIVRTALAILIKNYGNKNSTYNRVFYVFIFVIGAGFIFKGLYGSNNEVQVARVFWHETRYGHGILYLLAAIYLYNKNAKLSSVFILTDIAYSIIYRLQFNK